MVSTTTAKRQEARCFFSTYPYIIFEPTCPRKTSSLRQEVNQQAPFCFRARGDTQMSGMTRLTSAGSAACTCINLRWDKQPVAWRRIRPHGGPCFGRRLLRVLRDTHDMLPGLFCSLRAVLCSAQLTRGTAARYPERRPPGMGRSM